ncbi:MAG: FecR domain-containing protein [Opitutaceae bacterium]|nr:FecR domain-containing protein [Opitutaceae bacterium]
MSEPTRDLPTPELHRLAELAEKLREDTISDPELAELDSLLAESAAAREAFAALAMLATDLRNAHGRFRWPAPAVSRSRHGLAFVRAHRAVLALTACLALVAGLLWRGFLPSSAQAGPPVATVSNASGAELHAGTHPVSAAVGAALGRGGLFLSTGLLEFTYANGVVILVEAPARFELRDPATLWLGEGNISARVPEGARGFAVETASARIVDLGTEFGVSAKATSSEVHVFKGEVLVGNPAEPNALRLTENRASRIDTLTSTPVGIDYAPQRYIRSFEERASDFALMVRELEPVAYYRMRITPDATLLLDVADRRLNGVIAPGSSLRTSATGRIGAGLRLGGPAARSFAMVRDFPKVPAAALTVCAWVRADSRPRWASIAKHWAKEKRGQFHFGLWHDEGTLEVQVQDAAGREIGVRDTEPLPIGEWQFVAFTLDGATLRLYRNGREVASGPCAGLSPVAPDALGIGVKLDGGHAPERSTPGFWDGVIDELAIFHRALSAAQIRALHGLAP